MKALLICLEHNGRVLHEGSTDSLQFPIEVGRSPSCKWSVSGIDSSMSSHHAELFIKHRNIWIRDLESRNGITANGHRIVEKKLVPGDKIHLGGSLLTVESIQVKGNDDLLPYHRLEQLNGPQAGSVFDLTTTGDIHIGSDSSGGIVCLDPLVSKQHAALSIKSDGSCWVRDLGSRNGTSVNGVALAKDKERLLRDGDVLSVAYIEFRFSDKNVVHPKAHLLRKIGITLATIAFVLIGYYGYASLMPSSKMLLRRALQYAENGDFASAMEIADDAANARGAEAYSRDRLDVINNINAWSETANAWLSIKADIASGKWEEAQKKSVNLKAWDWNTKRAQSEGAVAEGSLNLIVAFIEAQKTLKSGKERKFLISAHDKLKQAQSDLIATSKKTGVSLVFTETLFKHIETILPEITATVGDLDDIESEIKSIGSIVNQKSAKVIPTVAQDILKKLNDIKDKNNCRIKALKNGIKSSAIVDNRVLELRAPLQVLSVAEKIIYTNAMLIAKADFDKVVESLPMPSPELSGIHDSIPPYIAYLEELNKTLTGTVCTGWKSRYSKLCEKGLNPINGEEPKVFSLFDKSNGIIDQVLKFVETPNLAIIKRDAPSYSEDCKYDQFIGVFDFYDFCEELDEEQPNTAIGNYGKTSENWQTLIEEIIKVKVILHSYCDYEEQSLGDIGDLVRYIIYVEPDGGVNYIKKMLDKAVSLLEKVERWAEEDFQTKCDEHPGRRVKILGMGVSILLSGKPDKDKVSELCREWSRLKREKWNGEDDSAQEFFDTALPGMGLHSKTWKYLQERTP